ncbi:asparagine synthase-related protein [Haloprofundus marisrubri]|uniref:asparagine synthase-related protein n=1 Tax=Haloprofundus marisrubri TaxID=1514971 RepID=UPI0009E4609D|nr:asparagine synthase-related protein [Haloprofundus marisrubri]
MIGVSGVFGDNLDVRVDWESTSENEDSYKTEEGVVNTSYHTQRNNHQPAVSSDNTHFWVWGDIYGYFSGEEYKRRTGSIISGSANYLSDLYDQHGREVIQELNGEFCAIMYNPERKEVSIISDHLGSRPVYYICESESIIFSTSISTISEHSTEISKSRIYEYLLFERTLGTNTLFEDIHQTHPASVLTYDLMNNEISNEYVYWRPTYDPRDHSFSEFVDKFQYLFTQAVSDRVEPDTELGVLMSGGSDSRLIAGCLSQPFTGYHMNESMNNEAQLAKIVTECCGGEFKLLKRSKDYYPKILDSKIKYSNFNGSFSEGHSIGFDNIDSDIVLSGLWSDSIFGSNYVPQKKVKIPRTDEVVEIPTHVTISSLPEFIELLLDSKSYHFSTRYADAFRRVRTNAQIHENTVVTAREILSQTIDNRRDSLSIGHIQYSSLTNAALFAYIYPISNSWSFFFHEGLLQQQPYRNPYIDRRLLELQNQIPVSMRLRKEIVNSTISNLSSKLSRIERADSGVPLNYPFSIRYLWRHLNGLRGLLSQSDTPISWRTSGSWPEHSILLRESSSFSNHFDEATDVIDRLPGISTTTFDSIVAEHMDGRDNTYQLHSLLTLTSHPAIRSFYN